MANPTWIEQTLPSEGIFYGKDCVVPTPEMPDGIIKIRAFTFREEEMLATAGSRGAQRVRDIINSCVQLPDGFDAGMLLVTDQLSILFYQRAYSLGTDYKFDWRCTDCKSSNRSEVDLGESLNDKKPADVQQRMHELYPTKYPLADSFSLVEPMELKLSSSTVGLRYLRVSDEKAIELSVRRAKTSNSGGRKDPSFIERRARRIVSIDGDDKLSFNAKLMFIEGLPYKDGRAFHNFVDKIDTGIDPRVMVTCDSCGADNNNVIEFGTEFFWPTDV